MKYCSSCKHIKPFEQFQKNRAMKDGYEHWCRSCKATDYRERTARRKAENKCHCGRTLSGEHKTCETCQARYLRWKKKNAKRTKQYEDERRIKLRKAVFDHYGRRCMCPAGCPFDAIIAEDDRCLTIDHINGGGNKHRKEVVGGQTFYRWLIRNNFPPEFRTLCYICNCTRGHYGRCPHEGKSDPLYAPEL